MIAIFKDILNPMGDRHEKIIIFDFDGTLADTLEVVISITNDLAADFGYSPTTATDLQQLQNLNSWQIIKLSNISLFKIPKLLRRVQQELQNNLGSISLFPGIPEALNDLKNQGCQLSIITSNSPSNVEFVLNRHGVLALFDNLNSESTLFGKHRIINRLLKQQNIPKHKAVYVGDETRDITAAHKSQIKSIAVTWGFNSANVLAQYQPDLMINQPQDLPPTIASLLPIN
ncbi:MULTISPECIES: HAD hydrolase-like protein [Limnospira]|uniref:Phosphoglycolate phosphatase (PGP) n=1 Tax=Limnospira indica PCC 8005 TaxID=376219 RepID=A0A9P1KA20_9CYAN|nr:HAD hydrolase-like protein [Limnospira indica]CDM92383.1 Phosphoglycolate phosphatase (PGP) [Limnospira indica PCC 8005]